MGYRDITLRVYDPEPLPPSIHAVSRKTKSGRYDVYLSANRTDSQRLADLLHEVIHIWHEDHDHNTPGDTAIIETFRHVELLNVLEELAGCLDNTTTNQPPDMAKSRIK